MSIIDRLAPKASCGFDGISSKIIKIIKTTLIKPITLIILKPDVNHCYFPW